MLPEPNPVAGPPAKDACRGQGAAAQIASRCANVQLQLAVADLIRFEKVYFTSCVALIGVQIHLNKVECLTVQLQTSVAHQLENCSSVH